MDIVKAAILSCLIFLLISIASASQDNNKQDNNKYVGVEKCRNCHEETFKGSQYMKWRESKHANAYNSLASEASKELATKLEILNPQENERCLKCHTTVWGVPKEMLVEKFEAKAVQCEQCHGPGKNHLDARLMEIALEEENEDDVYGLDEEEQKRITLPPGEINIKIEEKDCMKCHNEESPFNNNFNFEEAKKKIEHPDPRPVPKE